MKVAVSTACFYPDTMMDSLKKLLSVGIKDVEIFFNTDSELAQDSLMQIKELTDSAGCNICALHSFHSAYEWFYFFTDYPGRVEDGIQIYRKVFEAARYLNVDVVTFHGEHKNSKLALNDGFDILKRLYDVAQEYGVTLCQENVSRNRISTSNHISLLKDRFKNDIAFTIDIKQARRCDEDPVQMLTITGSCLKHVHLSAKTEQSDCALPLPSDTQIANIIKLLHRASYSGYIVVELYRCGFTKVEELMQSYTKLKEFIADLQSCKN